MMLFYVHEVFIFKRILKRKSIFYYLNVFTFNCTCSSTSLARSCIVAKLGMLLFSFIKSVSYIVFRRVNLKGVSLFNNNIKHHQLTTNPNPVPNNKLRTMVPRVMLTGHSPAHCNTFSEADVI